MDKLVTMRKGLIVFFVILMAIIYSCQPGDTANDDTKPNGLIGTWRLIDYQDYDSVKGKWNHTLGVHPKGYFTYTKSGIVNINGSAEKTLPISEDSAYKHNITIGALLDNAWGYFGTYTIDEVNSVVTHHPTGGSIPWYIGTDQHRQFIIRGDTLFIGDPTFQVGKRVLIREK